VRADDEPRGAVTLEIAVALVGRALLVLGVLGLGFRAISDDDYARVVIAERWVATPTVDPSGTSWLPLPFHVMGVAMAASGRSLAVARVASVGFVLASQVALHVALLRTGLSRHARLFGLAAAALLPWSLFCSAATVPEAPTAGLVAAALLFSALPPGRADRATRLTAGALALAATLCRYEAWPAAVVVALSLAWLGRAERGADLRVLALAVGLGLAGALGWMVWNRWSHGSATHFLFRVARYKRMLAQGGPEIALSERLLAYPRLLVVHFPEALVAALLLVVRVPARLTAAARVVLVGLLAVGAFLVVGNVNDGAPTHHAERAWLGVVTAVVALGAGRATEGLVSRRAWGAVAVALGLAGALRFAATEAPGGGAADRSAQVARGLALRGAGPFAVAPCAYEHFALLAAYGRPEDVTVLPAEPKGSPCPRVVLP